MTSDELSSLASTISGLSDLAFGIFAAGGEKASVPPVQGLGTKFRQVPSAKLDLVGGYTPSFMLFLGSTLTFRKVALLNPVPGRLTFPVRQMSGLCAIKAQILLTELSALRRTSGRLNAVELEVLIFSDPLFLRSLFNLGG